MIEIPLVIGQRVLDSNPQTHTSPCRNSNHRDNRLPNPLQDSLQTRSNEILEIVLFSNAASWRRVENVAQVELFQQLDAEEILQLAPAFQRLEAQDGEKIVSQGTNPGSVCGGPVGVVDAMRKTGQAWAGRPVADVALK